ncbi:YidB family protein [Streptomyces sp. NBC_01304]|uniref:YidB family protein n=1 Tax=Streptomyces sp. NBC_01304 TaxID=2903818 RepID=UPI002E105B24|nr:YidB family protein [Streptomyces sp. NBC_01304]
MAGNDPLGDLLGSLLGGGKQGGSGGGGGGGGILAALLSAFMNKGGSGGSHPLSGLLEQFNKAGLADESQSWVKQGENQQVTGAQVQQALPDETLQEVAQKVGVSPEQAANEIAQVLPQAVDQLTPQGQVPAESIEDLMRKQGL